MSWTGENSKNKLDSTTSNGFQAQKSGGDTQFQGRIHFSNVS